ncbi:M20/M25/M40 family metallo-hydrolase [Neobacillus drentensis]|uniref:M20/M25/M40 family metallo-hydrolase n=1 Tax=Neobacillus drentensis TaxID=220684 RepID=UPI002FFDDE69
MSFKNDALYYFRNMLKINTTNELATEYLLANHLKEILDNNHIDSQIVYSNKGRTSIISKLAGENKQLQPVILLSHLDVVAAKEEEWTFPPFSGEIYENKIWGRGTLDTKQLTAMHLMAFLHLKRVNLPLNRDVYFIATADEENGSKEGMEFISKQFPDVFKNSIVLSEGGGFTVKSENGETLMLFASGEKGTARVSITATGDGGHAGCPPENQAIRKLAQVLDYLMKISFPAGNYPVLQQFRDEMEEMMNQENEQGQLAKRLYEYMKETTVTPELIRIGDQLNVIPYKAEVLLEFRTLPNQTREQFELFMKEWTTPPNVQYQLLSFQQGYESDPKGEIISLFKTQSERLGFNMRWVPFTALGKTDGRFIGEMASQIYGLSPTLTLFTEVLNRVHNKDEHIELESFEYGVQLMKDVLEEFCISKGGGENVSDTKGKVESDH